MALFLKRGFVPPRRPTSSTRDPDRARAARRKTPGPTSGDHGRPDRAILAGPGEKPRAIPDMNKASQGPITIAVGPEICERTHWNSPSSPESRLPDTTGYIIKRLLA